MGQVDHDRLPNFATFALLRLCEKLCVPGFLRGFKSVTVAKIMRPSRQQTIPLSTHIEHHPLRQRKDVMERRIRVVGTLYIALGVFGVLASLILFIVMASGAVIPTNQETGVTNLALTIAGVCLLLLAIPSIIGGIGLVQHRPWARPLVIFLAAINLISFPLGTVVGAYALWVLLKPEARAMFRPGSDIWAQSH